ncbi:high-affinity branched-chain amino acid transport system permease protein LivM [Acrasis kona]|uniref:High-affinity branched-chain amino acid transport system permease protein LivM n=1 Tax=Acrasis kona TaxID=1008807 RepID=A0AAW2ZFB2_9EUKA
MLTQIQNTLVPQENIDRSTAPVQKSTQPQEKKRRTSDPSNSTDVISKIIANKKPVQKLRSTQEFNKHFNTVQVQEQKEHGDTVVPEVEPKALDPCTTEETNKRKSKKKITVIDNTEMVNSNTKAIEEMRQRMEEMRLRVEDLERSAGMKSNTKNVKIESAVVDEDAIKQKVSADIAKMIEAIKDPYFVSRGAVDVQMKMLYVKFGALLESHNIPTTRSTLSVLDKVIENTTDRMRKRKCEVKDEEIYAEWNRILELNQRLWKIECGAGSKLDKKLKRAMVIYEELQQKQAQAVSEQSGELRSDDAEEEEEEEEEGGDL